MKDFEDLNYKFGIAMIEKRAEKGLSISKLSDLTGINVTTLKRYESHAISPSGNNMLKIAYVLDFDLADLYPDCFLPVDVQAKIDAAKRAVIMDLKNSFINLINKKISEYAENQQHPCIHFPFWQLVCTDLLFKINHN